MKHRKLMMFITGMFANSCLAANVSVSPSSNTIFLQKQPAFFRFSFDDIKMPQGLQNVGLLGINYLLDLTPSIYGGISGYASVTGTQGGLFVLGFEGGLHHQFAPHWWADTGLFVGGGGGRSSYVGGGLMLRPHIGVQYDFQWARLGAHYSYVDFPSGSIRSNQIGLDLDIPCGLYYVASQDGQGSSFNLSDITLPLGKYLNYQRNDFALLLQTYRQKAGTKNVYGEVQDSPMGLVGAELDHFINKLAFWYVKAAGAFSGSTNGYMDILGGVGYHWILGSHGISLVPQFGIGAGGGGNVDTGGGVLVQPQLGLELPLSSKFSARFSGGYLWAPKGNLSAYTATGEIIYHLDLATAGDSPQKDLPATYDIQGWRVQLFNQTYIHPQRTSMNTTSAINLVAVQIDQLFTPHFFFSYQAASAYSGSHAGGLATGMIGPGLQTSPFFKQHAQLFGEVLVGAAGGGSLAVGGGAIIEPVVGLHYALTQAIGLQASVGQLKALHNNLNTPLFNLGFTVRFGTIG